MAELTSTESHSTQTLQSATWLTTTSSVDYEISPSPVMWWIICIALLVFLLILIIAIVCTAKRKCARRRHQNLPLDDMNFEVCISETELRAYAQSACEYRTLPYALCDGDITSYALCGNTTSRQIPVPKSRAVDYSRRSFVRQRGHFNHCVRSIQPGDQNRTDDLLIIPTGRKRSCGNEASLSPIAATHVTSSPHQSPINDALTSLTATNNLDAVTTAQTAIFTHVGDLMICACNNCDDCLVIPKGAVSIGESYTVTMETAPSFICTQHEPSDGYHLFAIKEFTEVKHRHFNKHVQIVLHYSLVNSEEPLTSDYLRMRYSTVDNKHFASAAYIPLGDVSHQQNLPDLFYTFDDAVITVYTTHFTRFKYESKKPIIGKCTSTKLITLVADVYGRKLSDNNSVEICVYVRDIYNEKKAQAQLKANDEREHSNLRHSVGLSRPLTKLPATISGDTHFDCYLSFLKTLWKEFDLEEEIANEASNSTTIPANFKPGCTMPRSMKAKDILRVPAHTLQPFGPFILKSTAEQLSNCIEACANIVVEHDESGVFVTSTIQINAAL